MKSNNVHFTKLLFILLIFAISSGNSKAQNPIIQTNYTADAASLVYKDRFYIYAGRDEASLTGRWFNMNEWRVYSSADMVNWTDHGACLKITDFSWASGDAWASHVTFYNEKFYWYVSATHKEKGGKAIGVAVSNSPTGPFTDAKGAALITTDMTPNQGDFDDIDPVVFIDDDGTPYMYWGNGKCKYVKLNPDMISFSGEIQYADVPKFGEAPWLQKVGDVYYLSYSSNSPSTIEYCTGPTVVGPWEYKGQILKTVQNCPTNHQAITNYKDNWYLVYHNGILPEGGGFRRSICIEEFSFNDDQTIPLILQTTEGVKKGVATLNPFRQTEAETIAWSEGVTAVSDKNVDVCISNINNGDYIKIRNVDFDKGAKKFFARVATHNKGDIEIRVDSIEGPIIGVCNIQSTGGMDIWSTQSTKIKKTKGVHDLYFVFKGDGDDELFNFDWWKFE